MRRSIAFVLVLLVAGAALWVLARDGPSGGAPRGPVGAPRETGAAVAPERGVPAPVTSAPVAPAEEGGRAPADEDDDPDAFVDPDDVRRRHWGEDDPERRMTWEELEVEYAARPLSARLREWRREVRKAAARPPGPGGGFSFDDSIDFDPPPTLPPVTGVVRRRADGAPVAGAQVMWARRESSKPPTTRTDGEGRFTLERIRADDEWGLSCLLVVIAPGFATLSCFPGVDPALELWLDAPGSIEVHYPAGTPVSLRALAFDPELQRELDDAAPDARPVGERGDEREAEPGDDEPDAPDDGGGEDVAVDWARLPLPPGEYDLAGPASSVRVTVRAGETVRVRLDEPGPRPVRLTVLDPDGRPLVLVPDPPHFVDGIALRLESSAPRPHAETVVTDAHGRIELVSRAGPYRVIAELTSVPWQPELAGTVHAEVDLGVVPGEGDHTLVVPRLVPFELSDHEREEHAGYHPDPQLLCLLPDHRCAVRTWGFRSAEPVVRDAAHPGRYAVVERDIYDEVWLVGELDLPTVAECPDVALQRVDIRWRPGIELGPEQAVRGRAWLVPLLLEGPGRSVPYPSTHDRPLRQGVMFEHDGGFEFWADGQGRIAGDPTLGGGGGRRAAFCAPGRYVLKGWSDLGPFRVEVDLPAPGGIDVDLRPR